MAFNLAASDDVKKDGDFLGSNFIWETDVYDAIVDMAYMEESKSKAMGMHLTLVDPNKNNRKLRETLWVTSGKAKGQTPFFTNKDGEKQYLPGWTMANDLCLTTVGKSLNEVANASEKRTIDVYDFGKRKNVPKEKPHVCVELLGQTVKVTVVHRIVNKRKANAVGDYVDTNEEKEENLISKFFYSDNLTTNEKETGVPAEFLEAWLAKNKGKSHNKFKAVKKEETAPTSAAAPAATPFG